jgi:putative aminopeptidase FrvX
VHGTSCALLTFFLSFIATALPVSPATGQSAPGLDSLVSRLAGTTAVTGYEQRLADTMLALLPGSARDRAGNAVRDPGGAGRRVLAVCPLDEPGWVVGNVRPDGYLTLRRSPGRLVPGRDAQLQGARVDVHTKGGVVPGVIAVRSVHLTRGRGTTLGPFTSDSAYLDLGATSAAEVERLGVTVLSVVTLAKRPHRYGTDLLAAPSAGRRAACAALLDAARSAAGSRGVVGFLVEQELGRRGLTTLANRAGPFAETIFVDAAGPVSSGDDATPTALGRVTRVALPVRYPGTPVETVSMADVVRLRDDLLARLRAVK